MTVSCITQQDVYVNILQSLFLHWTICYTIMQLLVHLFIH